MSYGDIRDEWRLSDIERKLQGKANEHEIHSLRSDVDSLERSLRESRSETSELRSQLQALQEVIEQLQRDCLGETK